MADIRKMTAAGMLAFMKQEFFKGIDIDAVTSMNEEQRREFTLAQADRLMGMKMGYDSAANIIACWFFREDLTPLKENPLIREPQQGTGAWIVELAKLMWQLIASVQVDTEYRLDPRQLGIERDSDPEDMNELFSPDNIQLLSWLKDTPYRFVGVRVARRIFFQALYEAHAIDSALSDYYADECDREIPDYVDKQSCDEYIKKLLSTVEEVKAHVAKGHELGLSDAEIGVVDSMWSYIPHNYPENYVAAAREIVEADRRMYPLGNDRYHNIEDVNAYFASLRPEIITIAHKYDVSLREDRPHSLPIGYLYDWTVERHYISLDDE